MWIIYTGIFTIKININLKNSQTVTFNSINQKFVCLALIMSVMKNGIENIDVMININRVDSIRSGWYPHIITLIITRIINISNIM